MVALTLVPEPVDGDHRNRGFVVLIPGLTQGLESPTAGQVQTGNKRHDNDFTLAWRAGAGADRRERSECLLKKKRLT